MKIFSMVKDNIIINKIVCDDNPPNEISGFDILDLGDNVQIGWELINNEWVAPKVAVKTFDETKIEYLASISEQLDKIAQIKGYDSIISLCSYKDDPNPKFAAEALAGINYRSAVWSYCTDVLTKVTNNEMEIPTLKDFIDNAPKIQWPTT